MRRAGYADSWRQVSLSTEERKRQRNNRIVTRSGKKKIVNVFFYNSKVIEGQVKQGKNVLEKEKAKPCELKEAVMGWSEECFRRAQATPGRWLQAQTQLWEGFCTEKPCLESRKNIGSGRLKLRFILPNFYQEPCIQGFPWTCSSSPQTPVLW